MKKFTSNVVPLSFLVAIVILSIIALNNTSDEENVISCRLKGPLSPDDVDLLKYIREKILVPPSMEKYNLKRDMSTTASHFSELFYINASRELFENKTEGFFVEVGALDGEAMSNTIRLEKHQRWTGLLIEPDRMSFRELQRKNRKAWLANVCISLKPYPSEEWLEVYSGTSNFLASFNGYRMNANNVIQTPDEKKLVFEDGRVANWNRVQCLPLQSLLLALEVPRVDLLSLDIERGEFEVLKMLDLDAFDVQVLFVETRSREKVVDLMQNKGYNIYKHQGIDYVFMRNKPKPPG